MPVVNGLSSDFFSSSFFPNNYWPKAYYLSKERRKKITSIKPILDLSNPILIHSNHNHRDSIIPPTKYIKPKSNIRKDTNWNIPLPKYVRRSNVHISQQIKAPLPPPSSLPMRSNILIVKNMKSERSVHLKPNVHPTFNVGYGLTHLPKAQEQIWQN